MRAVVKRSFKDLKEKVDRKEDEVFELSEERFKEIERKLPGYIAKVDEADGNPAPAKRTAARSTSTRAKKTSSK